MREDHKIPTDGPVSHLVVGAMLAVE